LKKEADFQRDQANENAKRAKAAEDDARFAYNEADSLRNKELEAKLLEIEARKEANNQTLKAERLRNLEKSRVDSYTAIQEINETEFEKGAISAINAHKLNVEYDGPHQNRDNYKGLSAALNSLQTEKQTLSAHKQSVRAIALNKSNDLIATGDEDGIIYISRQEDGMFDELQKFKAPGPIRSLTYSSRGEYLIAATFNKHITVWDGNKLNSNQKVKISDKKYPKYIKAIACLNFSGDDFVLVSTGDRVSIEKITSNGLLAIDTLAISNVEVITVSEDQSILLIGSGNNLYEYKLGESAVFSNPKITKLKSQIISLAISTKKEIIAAGLLSGQIYIKHSVKKNQVREYFQEHISRVSSLNFYEFGDRMQLTSTGFDQTVKMMDVEYLLFENKDPAEDKITIDGHDKWIHGGLYSSDGKYFLTIGEDQKVKSWHSTTSDLADSVQKLLDKLK